MPSGYPFLPSASLVMGRVTGIACGLVAVGRFELVLELVGRDAYLLFISSQYRLEAGIG